MYQQDRKKKYHVQRSGLIDIVNKLNTDYEDRHRVTEAVSNSQGVFGEFINEMIDTANGLETLSQQTDEIIELTENVVEAAFRIADEQYEELELAGVPIVRNPSYEFNDKYEVKFTYDGSLTRLDGIIDTSIVLKGIFPNSLGLSMDFAKEDEEAENDGARQWSKYSSEKDIKRALDKAASSISKKVFDEYVHPYVADDFIGFNRLSPSLDTTQDKEDLKVQLKFNVWNFDHLKKAGQ